MNLSRLHIEELVQPAQSDGIDIAKRRMGTVTKQR